VFQVQIIDKVLPVAERLLNDVWEKYGPFAALLILMVIWYNWHITRLWKGRLADKDKEIERLVAERDRLQDAILSDRQTSKKKGA